MMLEQILIAQTMTFIVVVRLQESLAGVSGIEGAG